MSKAGQILNETFNYSKWDIVHYTFMGLFKYIKKKGLLPSEKGTLGEGVYFWVSLPINRSDLHDEDELAIRIKPQYVSKIFNLEDYFDGYSDEEIKGAELVHDGKITPRYLEWLSPDGWVSL